MQPLSHPELNPLDSDATIETADVVIQTDHPSKIATAHRIAVATQTVI